MDAVFLQRDALGAFKHLKHRPVAIDHNDPARTDLAVFGDDLGHFIIGHALDAFHREKGAVQIADPGIFDSHARFTSPSVWRVFLLMACSTA